MPRDGTATRNRILDAAETLVIDHGYAATSVDQVVAASGTSKGAFFHHFDSKVDLARTLVERYASADVAELRAGVRHAESLTDPAARVEAFLAYYENRADDLMAGQTSCLYVSILAERQLIADGTAGPITEAILAWRVEVARLVRDALRARGRDDLDAEALADHVFVTFEGAFLLARSIEDPGQMRAQLRVLRQLFAVALA